MKIRFGGIDITLHHSGLAVLPASHTAIVSDLHLEKGSHFARRGYYLPPYDSQATLEKLLGALAQHQIRRVIFLGDSFHDKTAHERLAPATRALLAQLAALDCVWVRGNHDGDFAPEGFRPCLEHAQDGLLFRHEAAEAPEIFEVSGHYHPKAPISHKGGRLERPCFVEDGQRLVMPAFGAYAGGLTVTDPALRQLFRAEYRVHVLGSARIYSFSGALLGN
ncbi:MAG TPA: ligase-associated DNA damage response endonuclease PdeM [Patescibacteria group bacterium]|nr:ligase-associated DNA damage response endonuclease PdeM [Patescibacteria group bacterium]